MSPVLIAILLVLALLLPVIGAVVLRFIGSRLSDRQSYGAAALLLVLPVASVIGLSRANIATLNLAGITVVLTQPTVGAVIPQSVLDTLPTESAPMGGDIVTTVTVVPTNTVGATAVLSPTSEAATAQPEAASATPEPPSATLEPPTAAPAPATPIPPTAAPAPPAASAAPATPARRTYAVKSGDTLRSIASQFNVSVDALLQANNLTRQQGDALRIGQELVIP